MKRNKSIRVFLGILLTAFLLIPSGLSIKAEDLSEPSTEEALPEAVLEEASAEEAPVVEAEKEMLPVEEIEPAAEPPKEVAEEALPEEAVKEEKEPSPEEAQIELPPEEVPAEQTIEDLPEEMAPAPQMNAMAVPTEEKTLDIATYHGDLDKLNFIQYMEWMKHFLLEQDCDWEGITDHPLGFLTGIGELLSIDPAELLEENMKVLTIKKHWYDGDDPLRPHVVIAKLIANGQTAAYLPILKGTGYALQLYLPSKDQDGNSIIYTVEEEVPTDISVCWKRMETLSISITTKP